MRIKIAVILFLAIGLFLPAYSNSDAGIGVKIGQENDNNVNYIWINELKPNSPAQIAGLKVNDRILKVDGVSLVNKDVNKAASLLIGEAGTSVQILISRNGELINFDIKRNTITVANDDAPKWRSFCPRDFLGAEYDPSKDLASAKNYWAYRRINFDEELNICLKDNTNKFACFAELSDNQLALNNQRATYEKQQKYLADQLTLQALQVGVNSMRENLYYRNQMIQTSELMQMNSNLRQMQSSQNRSTNYLPTPSNATTIKKIYVPYTQQQTQLGNPIYAPLNGNYSPISVPQKIFNNN